MTPAPSAISDEAIDQVIEQQRAGLRACYRAIFEGHQPSAWIKIGSVKQPNGNMWDLTLFLALEPSAKVMEGALHGFSAAMQSLSKVAQPVQQQPGSTPAKSNAFGI